MTGIFLDAHASPITFHEKQSGWFIAAHTHTHTHAHTHTHPLSQGHSSEFVFDRVFGANTSQEAVFNEVAKPLIQHVVQGYNGCCFAYGQTGR